MKKIILSHFKFSQNFSNGVINYSKAMAKVLGNDYEIISNNNEIPQKEFRFQVLHKIISNYSPEDIIIEAPESQATSLYIPRNYNVHIRMHCPFHLYKRIIKQTPDEERYSEELRALYKAKAVSSPSYGMLNLLNDDLNINNVHVFKNPIEKDLTRLNFNEKDIDVIFLLRFNRLKGSEYINPILRLLPQHYKVKLIGKQEESFTLDSRVKCNVEIMPHVEGDEKYELLKRSKVSLSLSKFENCSMVILESIASGTPVVCWNVGGNSEIAKWPVINPIQYENIFGFADRIIELIEEIDYPDEQMFTDSINAINDDFIKGVQHVEKYLKGEEHSIYRGIDFSAYNEKKLTLPYELLNYSWNELESNPYHACFLISQKETYSIVKQFLKKSNLSATIISPFENESKNDFINEICLNWFANRKHLIELMRSLKVDITFYEEIDFSSENKEYDFTHQLKTPLSKLKYCNIDNVVYFDRSGSSFNSYISGTKILNDNGSLIKIIPNKDVLVICNNSCSFNKTNQLLLRLKEKLKSFGITQAALKIKDKPPKELMSYYYDYNSYTDNEFNHIILLGDSGLNKYIDSDLTLYCLTDSIYDNKDIIIKSNVDNLTLADTSSINNEHRKKVLEFLSTKYISLGQSNYQWFTDEVYAVISRFSFRASGRN